MVDNVENLIQSCIAHCNSFLSDLAVFSTDIFVVTLFLLRMWGQCVWEVTMVWNSWFRYTMYRKVPIEYSWRNKGFLWSP